MPNDTRELPAAHDNLSRFLGGSPLSVAFRLILLSILVGVVLAAIGSIPGISSAVSAGCSTGSMIWASMPSTGCGVTSCSAP